ncbi:MAG: hypothetical protein V4662_12990 [Verrucomicrobiota bacterium]
MELASLTLNSSTAFQAAPSKLGWNAMPPVFPVATTPREMSLGWDAMPAFGEAEITHCRSEALADFVRETRPVSRKPGLLTSFWSAISQRVSHA